MCGIFGFVVPPSAHADLASVRHDADLLFGLSELRGRQAAGLALRVSDRMVVYKRPETASKMMRRPGYARFWDDATRGASSAPVAVLGHCRLVTDGSELLPRFNHPMAIGEVVGVHNGVMLNARRYWSPTDIRSGRASDSETLFSRLDAAVREVPPIDAVRRSYDELDGSASVGLLFASFELMLVATNFGSLYTATERESGLFVFASESGIVHRYLERAKLPGDARRISIERVLPGTGRAVPLDGSAPVTLDLAKNASSPPSPAKRPPVSIAEVRPDPNRLKRCTRCILPETYPLIDFDEDGICSQCRKYRPQVFRGKEALERVLAPHRSSDGSPDCLVGLSGGQDSCYGLHLLVEELGMHPVAFNFDWIMTSKKARHNIAKVAGELGIEVIYRTHDYEPQAENIRKNIYAWLHQPELGMMPFVQAGDKWMYHYGRELRKELGLGLTVFCSGYQLEQREFFVGYAGIDRPLENNPRLYQYGWMTKLRLAAYYGSRHLKNPRWLNRSIVDNVFNFYNAFVARDDFLYLFEYYPIDTTEMDRVLRQRYGWVADDDYGENQWRMDDFHTAFNNYVYYTLGGFSEFDEFRSNQVREGLLTRDEAARLAARDNELRLESLRTFAGLVGFNLEHVLRRIEALSRLY